MESLKDSESAMTIVEVVVVLKQLVVVGEGRANLTSSC